MLLKLCFCIFQGVCRLIHCDLDKLRSGNVCQLRNETRPKYCPSFYVKITVNSFERNITSSRVNYWISEIEATIYQYIIPIHIVKVDLFAKSELYGTDQPLDFVVVKLLGDPYYVREAYSLNNLHRKMLTFYQRKNDIAFFEMEFHDEIIDRSGGIYIESKSDRQASWEKMTLFGSKEYYNGRLCRKRPIVQLHKTNLRPYVKLNIDEIPMTFLNGSLILNGRHLTISLSKFEYKVQNGTVFICLEDYLLFYNADLGPTTQNRASHVQSRLLVVIFIVQLFYSSFRLQRITLNDGRSIGLC